MNIKYFGISDEANLTLTVNLYSNQGSLIYSGLSMTEGEVCVYSTGNIFIDNPVLPLGIYVARVYDQSKNEILGHTEIAWDGFKEVDINTIDKKLWSEKNKREMRDALGLTGDKEVAKDGQLQKKSEAPYNNIVDTNNY